MRSIVARRRSPDVHVPGRPVLVTVALFLVAVLILVGADVRTDTMTDTNISFRAEHPPRFYISLEPFT
jgi:hypothetical protein